MANTFIIKEEVLNEVANIMKPTESQFNSNVRYFLHQLIADPVHAEIPTCIKMANISRSRFIKMLIDRGIVTRTEKLNDTDKNGNHKTPTMSVKYKVINKVPDELEYKVSKTDFDRKIEKLRRSIFEKNLYETRFNTRLGDQLAIAKNSPLTMGFIAPPEKKHDTVSWLMNRAVEAWNAELEDKKKEQPIDEDGGCGGATSASTSGQFSQPLFGMVRRINEKLNSDPKYRNRYRDLGGGFDVQLENGSIEKSLVTIQNKTTNTLYHICFDGANFNIYRDNRDGEPCSHVSYVFDKLLDAFKQSGYTNLNEGVKELKAKHSSGANFDKFDSTYMGSGCGSQAYGWGHYVSTDRKVSKGYKQHFKEHPTYQGNLKYGSYTYDVEIPEDNGRNYILWDGSPLQSLPFADNPEVKTFGEQYEKMASMAGSSPRDVSLKLANMGYTGIKVLPYRNRTDKDERLNFKNAANYVIFRDDDIEIIKKKEYTQKAKKYGNFFLIRKKGVGGQLIQPTNE